MENHEFNHEEIDTQDLSTSKKNSKPDMEEILRRRGPEFEPTPESITGIQQSTGQGTGQAIISPDPTTDPAGKTSDDAVQQQKDKDLEQKIEKLKLENETLKKQKIPEFQEQIKNIQQNKEQDTQQSNSEATQDDEYYQGYSY